MSRLLRLGLLGLVLLLGPMLALGGRALAAPALGQYDLALGGVSVDSPLWHNCMGLSSYGAVSAVGTPQQQELAALIYYPKTSSRSSLLTSTLLHLDSGHMVSPPMVFYHPRL